MIYSNTDIIMCFAGIGNILSQNPNEVAKE